MIRFASGLSDTTIKNRIEQLKKNTNPKAIQERELLLTEQEHRKKLPTKKPKKIKYPCTKCTAPLDCCHQCNKFSRWQKLPRKMRDYTK